MMKLSILDEILSNGKHKTPQEQEQQILKEAKELELRMLKKEIKKDGYEEKRRELTNRIETARLIGSFEKNMEELNGIIEMQEKSLKLSEKRKIVFEMLLGKKKVDEENVKDAEKLFSKRKLESETFRELVKEKHSELLELKAAVKKIFREQLVENEKKKQILDSTKKDIEQTEMEALAEKMVEDLMAQVNSKPEPIGFPKHEKIEIKELERDTPQTRRHRRHVH